MAESNASPDTDRTYKLAIELHQAAPAELKPKVKALWESIERDRKSAEEAVRVELTGVVGDIESRLHARRDGIQKSA